MRELHQIFGGLTCGRLLVAGAPGSGKSAAATLLIVDFVDHRARLDEAERAKVPVPVLVALAGWDPRAQPLRELVVHQLQRTSGPVLAGRRGRRTAQQLFDRGGIAVVLDGLDEMAAVLRPDAVAVLNDNLSTRMVVTGRSPELTVALHDRYLYDAVAVVLEPVEADRAATYLARTQPMALSAEWEDLVGRLREAPDGPLARALDTPLAITLVRDGLQNSGDVATFLALGAAPRIEQHALEDHLLDQLVETAYRVRPGRRPPRYDAGTARRTLRWVAARTARDGTSDVAWWRIPTWASRLPPALAVGVATAIAMFGVNVTGLAGLNPLTAVFAPLAAAGAALGAWCAAGAETAPPVRWTGALRRPTLCLGYGVALGVLSLGGISARLGSPATEIMIGLAVVGAGSLTGCSLWRRHRRGGGPLEPIRAFVLGFGLGGFGVLLVVQVVDIVPLLLIYLASALLSIGLALRLGLARTGPEPDASPEALPYWRGPRWVELVGWFLLAIPCGPLVLLAAALLSAVVTELGFVAFGLAPLCGAALGLVFPESWLTSFACAQLAIRHRLPLRLFAFLDDARAQGVLRAVGPVYRFRHVDLQRRLAAAPAARPPRYDRGTEDRALAWVEERTCGSDADEDPCRLAWWRIPTWAPRAPRVAAIGAAGGVITWVGFGLLDRSVWLTFAGPLVGCAAGVGAALGADRLDRRSAASEGVPRSPLPTVRHPALIGAAVGLASAFDLVSVIPPAVTLGLSIGLIAGAALWLLLGAVISVSRGGVARQRWRGITNDRPLALGLLLGVTVGHLGLTAALDLLALLVPLPLLLPVSSSILHLALSVGVLAVGLRIGARAPVIGAPRDPFVAWGQRRRRHLLVWLVCGGVAGAFVVRSGIRAAELSPVVDGTGRGVVDLTVALVLALAWGVLLGLLFPPTALVSIACGQLALRYPVPVGLARLLEDARDGGRAGADGVWITVPRAAP